MEINYLNNSNEASWQNYKRYVSPLLEKTCEMLDYSTDVSVSIVLVHDAEIKEYNKRYREIDRETDVLSFEDGTYIDDTYMMGDIIISVDAIRRQAKDYQHTLKREFSFLVVHGFLHLFGYDHQTQEDERIMINLQKEILNGLADRIDKTIN